MYLSVWWNVNFLYNSRLHNKIICMAKYLCSLWPLSCFLFPFVPPVKSIQSYKLSSSSLLSGCPHWLDFMMCLVQISLFHKCTAFSLTCSSFEVLASQGDGQTCSDIWRSGNYNSWLFTFTSGTVSCWWIEINQSLMLKWFVVLPWWSSG